MIWGGSTSVGSNAIQLAVAAGYEVITTAWPKNYDYVIKLGACQIFDFRSAGAVQDIVAAFQGKTLAGALAVGKGSAERCADIAQACAGRKVISMASTPVSFEKLADSSGRGLRLPAILLRLVSSNVALRVRCRRRGIHTKFIYGSDLKKNELSKIIYDDFLPQALADGSYIAAPDPYVVGQGLESVQAGLEAQLKGVSAKNVVVSL
ncbi:hypothetical protein [Arthrobacter sp. A5]|uniref:hypothetical protein n=1 Tax=Arthrobacter sp. A5 TaxID=576926 RepID=UPI003DA84FFE